MVGAASLMKLVRKGSDNVWLGFDGLDNVLMMFVWLELDDVWLCMPTPTSHH